MLRIGEFSKLTGLSIRALHYYEHLSLLNPAKIDLKSNYRYYSASQIKIANQIKNLQDIGFSLQDIKEILENPNSNNIQKKIDRRQQEIQQQLFKLSQQQRLLTKIAKKDEILSKYHVTIKKIPQRNVISLRQKVSNAQGEHKLWNQLWLEKQQQEIQLAQQAWPMTIFHEFDKVNSDIEVQLSIQGIRKNTNTIKFNELPEVQLATATFDGDYQQMPEVMAVLAHWIEDHKYIVSGPAVNIFTCSPAQSANSNDWVTTTGIPIKETIPGII